MERGREGGGQFLLLPLPSRPDEVNEASITAPRITTELQIRLQFSSGSGTAAMKQRLGGKDGNREKGGDKENTTLALLVHPEFPVLSVGTENEGFGRCL